MKPLWTDLRTFLSLLRAGANLNFLSFSFSKETQCKLRKFIHFQIFLKGKVAQLLTYYYIVMKIQLKFFEMNHFKANMIHRIYETFYDPYTSVKFD